MYQLRTLGTLDLLGTDGERIRSVLSQSKRLALLTYLAVARPRGAHRRDALLGLFWPELDQEHARSALRNALYFLRRAMGETLLRTVGEDVEVDRTVLRTDVEDFEAALARGERSRALELYEGDFLRGLFLSECPDFDPWVTLERDRLRGLAAAAAWDLAGEKVAGGDLVSAEQAAQRAMGLAPTDEGAMRAFLETLPSAGGRTVALRLYERYAALLKRGLELDPSAETRAVFSRIAALEAEAGPIASPKADVRPSVAVLPFLVPERDEDAHHFGIGVMDDILARLSRVKGLRVTSRTSAMHVARESRSVREVARELGVRAVLEGSVRRSDARVRVVAQLIDAETDDHVWAETYDRDLGDIFQVQTDIAERIAWALRAELSAEELASVRRIPTHDLAAWDRYVRALQAYQDFEPVGLAEALRHLSEAVGLDPAFAKAWALSAQVRVFQALCADQPSSAYFPTIREEAQRALALDPACGEAHAAMGMLKLFHDWDPAGAHHEFARALALYGDDPLALGWRAILLALEGNTEDGVRLARQGVVADPLSSAAHMVLGQVLVLAEQPEEAVRILEAACHTWPNALQVRTWLGLAHMTCDRPQAALPHYDWAVERSGGMAHFQALRATALVALGRVDEARATLDDLHARSRSGYVAPYSLFLVTLLLEGPAAALPHLQKMVEWRSVFLPYLRGIPRFRALRQDPRFREAIDRVWSEPPAAAS